MKNDIKDIDYEELNDDKSKKIRGKILYYMPSQVATILNQHFLDLKEPISESKVRFYTRTFGNLLGEEASNKPARFTEQDIEKFKFIVELKESGMTLKQIQEYCENVSFDENTGIQIKESNPLSIKSLATALLDEQNNQLQNFKKELLGEINDKLKQFFILQAEESEKVVEQLKQNVVIAVDDVVSEKLEENSKEISSKLNENSKELKQHIDESTEKSTQMQQENKKLLEEVAITMNDMKETNDKLKELLEDPEATKKIKKENDSWISKLAKKFK